MITVANVRGLYNNSFEKQKLADTFARLFLDYYRSTDVSHIRPDRFGFFSVERVHIESDNEWVISRDGDWTIRFYNSDPKKFSIVYRFADTPHSREKALVRWWGGQAKDHFMSYIEDSAVSTSPAL